MKRPNTIEVEYGEQICCPICSKVVVDQENAKDGEYFRVCDHTLYVAHDMGIDYASEAFKQAANTAEINLEDDEADPREVMLKAGIQDVHSFETYVPAPSFYGTYVAFYKQ